MRADKGILESAARIGFAEKPFVEYLDNCLEEVMQKMVVQVDEAQLRILQGHAQRLTELRTLIEKAPELLRKA